MITQYTYVVKIGNTTLGRSGDLQVARQLAAQHDGAKVWEYSTVPTFSGPVVCARTVC